MSTLNEIAELSGVSPSTVSRVLNNTAPISDEVKKRVLEAAQQLRYHKRSYSRRRINENVVGIILPEMDGYYNHLMEKLNRSFERLGYACLTALTGFDPGKTISAINRMAQIPVTCLLVMMDDTETPSPLLPESVRLSMLPSLLITSKYQSDLDVDCIYVDERRGNTLAVEHLLNRGYKKIGFIGENNTNNRCRYFTEIMKANGVPVNRSLIRIGAERGELGGYLRMKEILRSHDLPDAVYASYDQFAVGAIHAVTEAGLSIPRDIAIIGFDNIPSSQYIAGGITTVSTPFEDLAAISARILTHRVEQPFGQTQQVAIKPSLVVRSTT